MSEPAQQGLDPSPLSRLDREIRNDIYGYINRMVLVRHGRLVVDERYPRDYRAISRGRKGPMGCGVGACDDEDLHEFNYYHPDWHPYYQGRDIHTLQSVTKSVTSALIGIAIHRGEIPGVEARILPYFEDYDLSQVDPRSQRVTLEHLLTMRSGIEWHAGNRPFDETNTTFRLEQSEDWIQFTLEEPMDAAPGEKWAYNSGGSQLLAGILRKATGLHVDAYAKAHLFGPLGIPDYHWKKTPRGYPDTEGGLYLEAADLAKIGQLYLQDGVWQGRRILPEGWVRSSTAIQVSEVNARGNGYGYQWWRLDRPGVTVWAGLGMGGQHLLVLPQEEIVAVLNSWNIFGGHETRATLGVFLDAILESLKKTRSGGEVP